MYQPLLCSGSKGELTMSGDNWWITAVRFGLSASSNRKALASSIAKHSDTRTVSSGYRYIAD
jgi:hypothetical protein